MINLQINRSQGTKNICDEMLIKLTITARDCKNLSNCDQKLAEFALISPNIRVASCTVIIHKQTHEKRNLDPNFLEA